MVGRSRVYRYAPAPPRGHGNPQLETGHTQYDYRADNGNVVFFSVASGHGQGGQGKPQKKCAAVAQICYQRDVDCLVIRSISDNADAGARADSMMFHMMAAKNSASLVSEIVSLIGKPADEKTR